MATAPVKTANEWLEILTRAGRGIPDEVPKGFKTVNEISKETGKSNSQTSKYLREALKLGLVEHAKFSIPCGNKLYPTAHYRICNFRKPFA